MASSLRSWASSTKESVLFHLSPPVWSEVVDEALPFGPDAEGTYRDLVEGCYSYLEYGAGASTIYAVRHERRVVAVESDSRFLAAVEDRCRHAVASDCRDSEPTLLHADIGPTGPWGKPVFPRVSRPRRWRHYPEAPWEALGSDYRADLVLIDGRFRVACALAVMMHQADSDWTILVDDYPDRPQYAAIAEYARLTELRGRMAVFRPAESADRAGIERAFERFVADWR